MSASVGDVVRVPSEQAELPEEYEALGMVGKIDKSRAFVHGKFYPQRRGGFGGWYDINELQRLDGLHESEFRDFFARHGSFLGTPREDDPPASPLAEGREP